MAILPTRLVEVEFDAGVWTDVFADVVDVSTRRGRNRESGAYETGTMTFTVRNDARKYDPDYAAGPYFGKLRPNRRVRFRATYNAITYPVFLGYVDRIAQNYGGPNDATATFTASDRFKILNRADVPQSVYAAEVKADTPQSWYQLDDPAASTTARDAVVGRDAAVDGTVTFGGSGLVSRAPGTSMIPVPVVVSGVLATPAGIRLPSGATPTGTGPFTFEFIIKTTATTSSDVPILEVTGGATADRLAVGLTTFTGQVGIYVSSGATFATFALGLINDGFPHHVAVVRSATTITVYTDGVARGTMASTANLGGSAYFGMPGTTPGTIAQDVTLDEFAVYPAALTAARVTARHDARKVGGQWNGELPGARLARILALAGLTAGDYSLDAGTTALQSTSLTGTTLGYAQKVEETEAGYLFVDRSGLVRFVGRDAAVTGAYLTSQATLVDHVGGGLPYRSVSADVDEVTIVTRATVSREGSIAMTHSDAPAITEFQIVDETHDGLLHNSDAYSLSYAQWIVSTHREPRTRLGALSLDLPADPTTLYPGVLGRELAERVTYKRQPQNVVPTIDVPMRIEAIAHETGGHYWRTTLQLSPFNLGQNGYGVGVWDVSLWDQSVWGI